MGQTPLSGIRLRCCCYCIIDETIVNVALNFENDK